MLENKYKDDAVITEIYRVAEFRNMVEELEEEAGNLLEGCNNLSEREAIIGSAKFHCFY